MQPPSAMGTHVWKLIVSYFKIENANNKYYKEKRFVAPFFSLNFEKQYYRFISFSKKIDPC